MMAMEYIGHTSDDGRKQLLLDHLNGTSKLCRENANEFWADIAKFVGQIHDIGKVYIGFSKTYKRCGKYPSGTRNMRCKRSCESTAEIICAYD